MNLKAFREISRESIVSDFRLKIKVVCVCLLIPTIVIELYNLFFMGGKLYFPALEFGVAVWSLLCAVFLVCMCYSDSLKGFSLKSGVAFSAIRKKIIFLISIFLLITAVFAAFFVWEFKNREDWQQGVTDVEKLLFQMKQEEN
ncbi:MAG: hypothetical protein ACYSUT_08275 [Planctomycetota bacterium]